MTIGGAALCAGLFVRERLGRLAAERRVAEAETHAAQLNDELRNYRRARNNKLYRHALEDVGFAATQALLRVKAERQRLNDEWTVIEQLLETGKKGLQ